MPNPTRAEREQRIERDDGAPDGTVFVTGWRTSGPSVYHDNPDCTRLKRPEDIREHTREDAQQQGKPPCLYCVLEERSRGGVRGENCPYCGEEDIHLTTHLPCDGAGKDTVEAISDD